ncbi:GNAT family protein [Pedobacter heparinus]|uniref:GNAT family N-acetyltransferase n=1 Tax=Pedobacter heparinus TaxID=984 RepID=UPI00292F26A9|nr:GNAT family protein [Pedobacter heparinus]
MNLFIYLRPLELADAHISYRWRNDPEIWEYTGFKPDRYISPEMEIEWLSRKLKKRDEKRFAICLLDSNQYIGNVQLLEIQDGKAWFHIFIGEKELWGLGISQKATTIVTYYAFAELGLKSVQLSVNPLNVAAYKIYEKNGFTYTGVDEKNGFLEMTLTRESFSRKYPLLEL